MNVGGPAPWYVASARATQNVHQMVVDIDRVLPHLERLQDANRLQLLEIFACRSPFRDATGNDMLDLRVGLRKE